MRAAASSGLEYSVPWAKNVAPAMLLFPAPLVPANTLYAGDPIGIRHAYALLLPEQLALIALVMLRTLLSYRLQRPASAFWQGGDRIHCSESRVRLGRLAINHRTGPPRLELLWELHAL